jgi:hypothetical protein
MYVTQEISSLHMFILILRSLSILTSLILSTCSTQLISQDATCGQSGCYEKRRLCSVSEMNKRACEIEIQLATKFIESYPPHKFRSAKLAQF